MSGDVDAITGALPYIVVAEGIVVVVTGLAALYQYIKGGLRPSTDPLLEVFPDARISGLPSRFTYRYRAKVLAGVRYWGKAIAELWLITIALFAVFAFDPSEPVIGGIAIAVVFASLFVWIVFWFWVLEGLVLLQARLWDGMRGWESRFRTRFREWYRAVAVAVFAFSRRRKKSP